MRGLGTLANVLAVLLGSGIGMVIQGGIKDNIQKVLIQACGLAVLFIGIGGSLSEMLLITDRRLKTQGTLLLVLSLVLGGLIGAWLDIEGKMEKVGETLRRMIGKEGDNRFVDGFVTSTLVICVGAMAVVGSIQDGLTGDASMLYAKALLDFVIVMVFASTLGVGVLFSAIPMGLYQGGITILAVVIAPLLGDVLISQLSLVGNVLIFGVGVNLCFEKRFQVGNLLPALLIPIGYRILTGLI
ncbi:MAG: DUF554 domain-containing protein [Tissierellia bacterium]|nr:DUF554 domain-containing protein [Tissierellia bacterium]